MNLKRILKMTTVCALVIALGFGTVTLTGCGKKDAPKEEAKGEINPLTGLELEEGESLPDRVIMVSTDNDSRNARPQAGISLADILIEVPIEGGGSRYEPIYYSNVDDLELLGAVRSARPYILDLASEFNAVFVHDGYSPQAQAYFSKCGVDRVSGDTYSKVLHKEDNSGHYYASGDAIKSGIEAKGFDKKVETRQFKWLGKDDKVGGKKTGDVEVNYAAAKNTFKYDADTKLYTKYVYGEVLTDRNNDKELTFSNILVQKVPYKKYDEERLNIDMFSSGDALLFTQGKVLEGTWERDSRDGYTVFKDKDGKEFKMTPGKTAWQLVDTTVKVKY